MATRQIIKPFPEDEDRDAFGHWLSGFTDGEGCFSLHSSLRNGKRKTKYGQKHAVFIIQLRIDDSHILDLIQSFLGCGIRDNFPQRNLSNPSAAFRVHNSHDLLNTVIPNFMKYPLRAKKRRDFEIWKKGVELIYRISQRKRRRRRYKSGGFLSRWTDDESREFATLISALRDQRKIDSYPETSKFIDEVNSTVAITNNPIETQHVLNIFE